MFEKIKLNYNFNDLEPNIDKETMETHYEKHYNTYKDNLNNAISKSNDFSNMDIIEILRKITENHDYYTQIHNNGGGYINHSMYFEMLSPNPNKLPETLNNKINKDFRRF